MNILDRSLHKTAVALLGPDNRPVTVLSDILDTTVAVHVERDELGSHRRPLRKLVSKHLPGSSLDFLATRSCLFALSLYTTILAP